MIEHSRVAQDHLPTKLLYVEDDEDLREMIADTFVDAGFDVTPVSSAEAAFALLANEHYDVIVTDYNLTGNTGAWLLASASAKGLLERTAAIVLTSERRPEGVDGYKVLRKPIDFGILIATISDAVDHLLHHPVAIAPVGPSAVELELELVLYVTGTSQESKKAIRNLHRALKRFDKSRFRLTIVDVASDGDDDWYEALEEDRVIVTPTLVKKKPGPKTWIVGTLAPIDAVEQMLDFVLGPR